ncbi:MAG: hypothetical protein RL156_1046 [Bacteroidota bacterium]|jgi:hypothetical protein
MRKIGDLQDRQGRESPVQKVLARAVLVGKALCALVLQRMQPQSDASGLILPIFMDKVPSFFGSFRGVKNHLGGGVGFSGCAVASTVSGQHYLTWLYATYQ